MRLICINSLQGCQTYNCHLFNKCSSPSTHQASWKVLRIVVNKELILKKEEILHKEQTGMEEERRLLVLCVHKARLGQVQPR